MCFGKPATMCAGRYLQNLPWVSFCKTLCIDCFVPKPTLFCMVKHNNFRGHFPGVYRLSVDFIHVIAKCAGRKDRGGRSQDRLADVRITAHPAGHTLGGAIWHLSVQGQDFVYAVSMNLQSDSHLAACTIQSLFHRPALLITDATCAGRPAPPPSEKAVFLDSIMHTLRRYVSVLPFSKLNKIFV